MWIILFYILLSVGAICGILSFIVLISMTSLIIRLSERLSELVDILFRVGNQAGRRDDSIERLPGRGQGLQDVPEGGVSYDQRYSAPISQEKWGTPIDPTGKVSKESWDSNL